MFSPLLSVVVYLFSGEWKKGSESFWIRGPWLLVLNRIIRSNHQWPRIRHKKLRKTLALWHAKLKACWLYEQQESQQNAMRLLIRMMR